MPTAPHTNIIDVFNNFQTQEQAIQYLEDVRWGGQPICPYCKSAKVGVHSSNDRKMPRWQCQDCHRPFAVTVGTIFHGTHIPLRDWFLCIALMLNAKKSASAYQIARDLGMRRPTVWSMMHRIRLAMANDPEQSKLMHGIVEADETYIGARRKRGTKRGRPGKDSHKTPELVAGAVRLRRHHFEKVNTELALMGRNGNATGFTFAGTLVMSVAALCMRVRKAESR